MQCPNCREVENGVWMRFEINDNDEITDEDEWPDDNLPDMVNQEFYGFPYIIFYQYMFVSCKF